MENKMFKLPLLPKQLFSFPKNLYNRKPKKLLNHTLSKQKLTNLSEEKEKRNLFEFKYIKTKKS